jgi:hypothetical protein
VKRSSLVLTTVAGLAVFLAILVLYLPAGWFAGALPAQLRCNDLGGSVWQGECAGLSYQGNPLGDATWNLSLPGALTGRIAGDLAVRGNALTLDADLDTDFSGVGELRNLKSSLVMDPALLPLLPAQQRGTVTTDLERVVLAEGGGVTAVAGRIELRDFRQLGAGGQPVDLGSYEVVFDPATTTAPPVTGKVRDLGGPFIVDATLTLNPARSYVVQGYITGRTAAAERTVREITLGATPDTSGRSVFSFEGSY